MKEIWRKSLTYRGICGIIVEGNKKVGKMITIGYDKYMDKGITFIRSDNRKLITIYFFGIVINILRGKWTYDK